MPSYLKQWFVLPHEDKLIACRVWCAYVYWHCVIKYLPFRFWKNQVIENSSQLPGFVEPGVKEFERLKQLIKLSESVGRHHFIQTNCLRRTMVQKSLLNRSGLRTQLSIGVKKSEGEFAAHCWLTYKNQIINDSQDNTNEYITLEKVTSKNLSIFKSSG